MMKTYRFYCLGDQCRVDAVRVGEFRDDDDAHAAAEEFFQGSGSYALEVWTRSTLVARLERGSLAA
jgi:hypothetical protein